MEGRDQRSNGVTGRLRFTGGHVKDRATIFKRRPAVQSSLKLLSRHGRQLKRGCRRRGTPIAAVYRKLRRKLPIALASLEEEATYPSGRMSRNPPLSSGCCKFGSRHLPHNRRKSHTRLIDPFAMMIPRSETERLLEERLLSVKVEAVDERALRVIASGCFAP